jgi:prepilin-type N-terminal cleavage/methylation domain-containing protein
MANRQHGYTLAELLVVCAVLAVTAAVALPSAQPVAEFRADAAAGEVVQALRFARQEAMRTNAYRMLACDLAKNQLSVILPDGSADESPKDPLTKMNHNVVLGQAPAGSNATLGACSFKFADNTSAPTLGFDPSGNPVRGSGPAAQALTGGTILVTIGNATRTIAIDANARVTSS